MLLQDFNDNFKIDIRNIAVPHIDESGTYPACVGFNIVCLSNNRVNYFEDHITDSNFVASATDSNLISYSWSNLKQSVLDWADIAITQSNLIGFVYTPSNLQFHNSNELDLDVYNSNYTTTIGRFEVYPRLDPNSWCVGFNINHNSNSKNMYIDTRVEIETFAVTSAENEILEYAWSNTNTVIGTWALQNLNKSSLLNTQYVPETI